MALKTASDEKCRKFNDFWNDYIYCDNCGDLYHDGLFCAGGCEILSEDDEACDGKDACKGDSGSAIFIKNHTEQKVIQIGLVSGSRLDNCGSGYSYYTRVSHYLKWILDNLEK